MHKIAYSSRSTRAFAMLVLSGWLWPVTVTDVACLFVRPNARVGKYATIEIITWNIVFSLRFDPLHLWLAKTRRQRDEHWVAGFYWFIENNSSCMTVKCLHQSRIMRFFCSLSIFLALSLSAYLNSDNFSHNRFHASWVNNYLKVNAFINCTKMIREKYDQVFCC